MKRGKYFTVLFEGDITAFPSNPLKVDTIFGIPDTIAANDVFAERDRLESELDCLGANARVQAKLLADTGRERDELKRALEAIERGTTSVLLTAKLRNEPIDHDVVDQIRKDAIRALAHPYSPAEAGDQ